MTCNHAWHFVGCRNAGHNKNCECSVGVFCCKVCGVFDYGTEEEERTKSQCDELLAYELLKDFGE